MHRSVVSTAAALLLIVTAHGVAEPQRRPPERRPTRRPPVVVIERREARQPSLGVEFGVRGGYDFEDDVGSAGAQLRIPLARPLHLAPSADVYFGDARTDWQLNTDLVVRPALLGGVYAGIGGALVRRDFDDTGEQDTKAGYNLLVGLRSNRIAGTSVRPFAEARWTHTSDYSPFRLVAGIDVPISGRR
jgi:hypothetical protein